MLSYVRVSLPQVLSDFHLNTGKSSKVKYIFCFFCKWEQETPLKIGLISKGLVLFIAAQYPFLDQVLTQDILVRIYFQTPKSYRMKSWWDILLISHLGPRSFFVFGMLRMDSPDLPVSVTLNMLWEQRLFWTAGFWDSLLLYTLQPVLYLCSTLQPLLYPCHSVPTFAFALHANCTLHVVPLLSTDCAQHRIHCTVHSA